MNTGVVRLRPTQKIWRFDCPSASADPPKSSFQIASYPRCAYHARPVFATNEADSAEEEARSCFQTVSRVTSIIRVTFEVRKLRDRAHTRATPRDGQRVHVRNYVLICANQEGQYQVSR
ncbi:hypothetical protein PILCRDRAFT_817264 [Piloderma croceum F 1598]|uniref:Uncharacterized protein n=1 Tax=Piloderma croceum (strain F 1598) TaxID=765440 RepID=A0A0C3FZU7_PILCF|nr:hypothetical protein PILCRDRAFT_817264 [Piloderma croceum F 1598]